MAGKYAHIARIKATTSSNSRPNPKLLFIHELSCGGRKYCSTQKRMKAGYLHPCVLLTNLLVPNNSSTDSHLRGLSFSS